MRNFQGTFETRKRSRISAFSICMAVPQFSYFFLAMHENGLISKLGLISKFMTSSTRKQENK